MFRVPELCSSPIVLVRLLVPRFSARASRHCGSSFSAAADCDASDAAAAAAATRCLLLPVLLLMFLVLSQRLVQSSLRVVGGLVCSALHSAACHIVYVAATHTHSAAAAATSSTAAAADADDDSPKLQFQLPYTTRRGSVFVSVRYAVQQSDA